MPLKQAKGPLVRASTQNLPQPTMALTRKGISTRSQSLQTSNGVCNEQNIMPIIPRGKRKADASPPLKQERIKRSALGNLTNANVINTNSNITEKQLKHSNEVKKTAAAIKTLQMVKQYQHQQQENCPPPPTASQNVLHSISHTSVIKTIVTNPPINGAAALRPTKVMTRAAARGVAPIDDTATVKPRATTDVIAQKPVTRRISNEFEKSDNSLYMSALEELDSARYSSISFESQRSSLSGKLSSDNESAMTVVTKLDGYFEQEILTTISSPKLPEGVTDFDKENWNDPFQVSHYAADIFEYLKDREKLFEIDDYIKRQAYISKWMRSLLVDWMVEVQETFELNHETLYLSVKIVDIYLGKVQITKEKLQLLGAAALFIACKYDERIPPLIEDFLYICDRAYTQTELIRMEIDVFRTIGYDLGIPLSYRFLRRYARCGKIPMPILTLARYILENSLMNYETIRFSDSQLACATLFMALRMSNLPGWDDNLKHHSGYNVEDFAHIIPVLHLGLSQKPRDTIKTIRNKYSHKIFHEVAKIPILTVEKFFEGTNIV